MKNLDDFVEKSFLRGLATRLSYPDGFLQPTALDGCVGITGGFLMLAYLERWHEQFSNLRFDSPIERVLSLALQVTGESISGDFVAFGMCSEERHASSVPSSGDRLDLCHQHTVGGYFLDFLLRGYRDGALIGSVAIEADGHDFHERTREQARRDRSRDRKIQQEGFKVFRYTGSEIWADPVKCAEEAVCACLDVKAEDRLLLG